MRRLPPLPHRLPHWCHRCDQAHREEKIATREVLPEGSTSLVCLYVLCRLGQADSLRRTNTCACAALCASISINHVALCTFRDSLYWALTCTCSTRNAIFTNYVCHNSYKLKLLILLLLIFCEARVRLFLISTKL